MFSEQHLGKHILSFPIPEPLYELTKAALLANQPLRANQDLTVESIRHRCKYRGAVLSS